MQLQAVLFLASLGTTVLAQEVQSKPFHLILHSEDDSVDGKKLTACHSGAAIETLCLTDSASTFYLNTTEGAQDPIEGYEPISTLVWSLPLDPVDLSQPMRFSVDPSTNVAMPLFEPSYTSQDVTVEKTNGQLAIITYIDDTKTPPTVGKSKARKNWVVCQTYYGSYQYQTLNWVLGNDSAEPQNPSCVKVEVERKFTK